MKLVLLLLTVCIVAQTFAQFPPRFPRKNGGRGFPRKNGGGMRRNKRGGGGPHGDIPPPIKNLLNKLKPLSDDQFMNKMGQCQARMTEFTACVTGKQLPDNPDPTKAMEMIGKIQNFVAFVGQNGKVRNIMDMERAKGDCLQVAGCFDPKKVKECIGNFLFSNRGPLSHAKTCVEGSPVMEDIPMPLPGKEDLNKIGESMKPVVALLMHRLYVERPDGAKEYFSKALLKICKGDSNKVGNATACMEKEYARKASNFPSKEEAKKIIVQSAQKAGVFKLPGGGKMVKTLNGPGRSGDSFERVLSKKLNKMSMKKIMGCTMGLLNKEDLPQFQFIRGLMMAPGKVANDPCVQTFWTVKHRACCCIEKYINLDGGNISLQSPKRGDKQKIMGIMKKRLNKYMESVEDNECKAIGASMKEQFQRGNGPPDELKEKADMLAKLCSTGVSAECPELDDYSNYY